MATYRLERRDDAWWITTGDESYGPYATRQEAEADRRGLVRYDVAKAKGPAALRRFVTCEK